MRENLTWTIVGVAAALLLASCTHRGDLKEAKDGEAPSATSSVSGGKEMRRFHLNDPKAPEIVDHELETIPTEVNPMVDKWVNYFQGRGRRHMERYLARSTRYEAVMKRVLRDNGLPEDLFYIALIESGFSSSAVSHASAVGYWQFIRGTGKRYGLEISRLVDERRDPVLATEAAAEYFRGLYSVFGSWYLAMASYNVGENRVKREVMKHQTRDFWELARKARFPSETINYVPKFIAAKMIAKDPAKYGFEEIDYLPPIEFDTVEVTHSVNLRVMAEKMSLNYEDFKALNPKFKGEIAPDREGRLSLRIPPGQTELAVTAAADAVPEKIEYVADVDTQRYRIRRGDNLSSIARRFRTSVAYLRDLNDLPRGRALRVGSVLYVPDRTPLTSRATRTARTVAPKAPSSKGAATSLAGADGVRYHVVRSGDSLYTIARRYGTTISALSKANNIHRGRVLRVGVKLIIPVNGEEPKAEASRQSGRRHPAAKAKVHVVRRGENLSRIAAKYRVSVDDIRKKNRIRNPSSLMAGARLMIPAARADD